MRKFKYHFRTTVDLGPIPVDGGGMSMQFHKISARLFSPVEIDPPTLLIPPFDHGNAVPDAVAGTWDGTLVDFIRPESVTRREVRAGCIGLVVESPHKNEFGGPFFTPLWPLNNENTKRGIHDHLGRLIGEAGDEHGVAVPEADVVYINPVQFQTSLARYMRDSDDDLLDAVRNAVWKTLFDLPAVRNDFLLRLATYRPALLFIATTSRLKPIVLDSLWSFRASGGTGVGPCLVLNRHPAVWLRKRPSIVRCER